MKKIILFLSLVLSTCIAEAQWSALGAGLTGRVKALTVFNGEIYAGGTFSSPNHVAKWNAGSNTWLVAGNGLNDSVSALVVHAGQLYAGGSFTTNGGGTTVNRIAVLNTSTNTWDPIGSGLNNFVRALFSDGTDLYIGGAFNNSGSPAVSRIAKLNGSAFAQVGDNPLNVVYTITKFNGAIYIGGAFSPSFLKKLVGSTWQELSGLNNTVYSLYPYAGYLYIGGDFTSPTQKIARTNNTSISSTINNLNSTVHALYATPTKLFGGGSFTQSPSSTVSLPHFFSQNGNTPFFAEGSNFNGDILAITNFNGKIVVGGSFTASGSTPLNSVSISSQTIDVEEVSSVVADKIFYPNPMSNNASLRIETTQAISKPTMKIVDAGSRLVRTVTADPISGNNTIIFNISREGMAAGNYFYVVEDENGNALLSDIFLVD